MQDFIDDVEMEPVELDEEAVGDDVEPGKPDEDVIDESIQPPPLEKKTRKRKSRVLVSIKKCIILYVNFSVIIENVYINISV